MAEKPFRARIHPENTKQQHFVAGMQVFKRGHVYEITAGQKAKLDEEYMRFGVPESGRIFQTGTADELKAYDQRKLEQSGKLRGSIDKPLPVAEEKPAPTAITTKDLHSGGRRGPR